MTEEKLNTPEAVLEVAETLATDQVNEDLNSTEDTSKVQSLEVPVEEVTEEVQEEPKAEEEPTVEGTATCHLLSNGLVRIPVAKKGSFYHEAYGKVSFTDQDFEDIVRNYKESVLGFDPYATWGHLVDPKVSVDAELKKGSLKDFEVEDDVLYALTEPTPDTLELIQNEEYEYASGEFIRNYSDKVTGENKGTVLMRYALTNSPFIPFNDKKIEMVESLSANSPNECSHSVMNFMLKLNADGGNVFTSEVDTETLTSDKPKEESLLATEIEDSSAPTNTLTNTTSSMELQDTNLNPEVVEAAAQTEAAPTQEVLAATTEPEAPAAAPQFDVNKLVEQVVGQVSTAYQAQLDSIKQTAEATINSLKAEITNLTDKLASQGETVQAFSNSMSAVSRANRYQAIAAQGVPAALIERFSQLESQIETGSKVIKLSSTAGETEVSLSDAISQLLIDAVQTEPVQLEQFGQSISAVEATGFAADMRRLIDSNREAAKKVSL